jgi:hypothetical protein
MSAELRLNEPTFHLPRHVADEMVVAGVARAASSVETKGLAVLPEALVVLNTVTSVIQLTQGPSQVRHVATALARWRSNEVGDPSRPYQLLAPGPHGSAPFSLGHAPDENAIARFILREVYGTDEDQHQ